MGVYLIRSRSGLAACRRTSRATLVLFGLVSAPLLARADVIVDPPLPTTADSIRITVTGASSNPCVGVSSSHTVIDGKIHVAVRLTPSAGVCIQVLGSWAVTETVGRLAAGDHALLVTVDAPCCFPCGAGKCVEQRVVRVEEVDDVPSGTCAGDCHGRGSVTVAEIITMVDIALGGPLDACRAGDADSDGQITVDEILTAVNNALRGCAEQPCAGIAGAPCPANEVCDLRDASCSIVDLGGTCTPRPHACPEIVQPVCGCDGVTYANDCERLRAGATLASVGGCQSSCCPSGYLAGEIIVGFEPGTTRQQVEQIVNQLGVSVLRMIIEGSSGSVYVISVPPGQELTLVRQFEVLPGVRPPSTPSSASPRCRRVPYRDDRDNLRDATCAT